MNKLKTTMSLILCLCASILLMPNGVLADESTATKVTSEAELRNALENGEDVSLQNNITVSSKSLSTVDNGRDRSAIVISSDVTVYGNGYSIETSNIATVFDIYNTTNTDTVDVTFDDVTIKNTCAGGRAIDTRTGYITLNLNKTNLEVTTLKNNADRDQALTIGGNYENPITVNITNSNIKTGKAGYAIITFNPVNLTIDSTNVTGYSALVMKGINNSQGSAGSTVTIKNGSVMKSINDYNGRDEDYAFATIVLEDDNINVNVIASTVEASGTGTAKQYTFSESANATIEDENTITVDADSTINARTEEEIIAATNTTVRIEEGATSNQTLPEEYVLKTITVNTSNGTVTVDKTSALEGEKVAITANPNKDYVLESIKVLDEDGNEITVEDGKFMMPASNVEVTVTFKHLPNPATGDNIMYVVGLLVIALTGLSLTYRKLIKA